MESEAAKQISQSNLFDFYRDNDCVSNSRGFKLLLEQYLTETLLHAAIN